MKITVIHGSQRKGNTEKTIEIIKSKLNSYEDIEYYDVYLPKDLPHFCCGCFQCIEKGIYGGEECPHKEYTHGILEAMKQSEGIIITTPVYCLGESGQVKVFLDHFGGIFMSHRPLPEMFFKRAIVVSTTAGGGTKHAIKPIERSLQFWGVPKIYKCGLSIWGKDWDDMPKEKQLKYSNLLEKKTEAFYKSIVGKKVIIPIKTRFLFNLFKNLIKGYPTGHPDKEYWKMMGWLEGKKPWDRRENREGKDSKVLR